MRTPLLSCVLFPIVETPRLSPGHIRVVAADHGLFDSRTAVVRRRHCPLRHPRTQSPPGVRSEDSRRKDTDCWSQVTRANK